MWQILGSWSAVSVLDRPRVQRVKPDVLVTTDTMGDWCVCHSLKFLVPSKQHVVPACKTVTDLGGLGVEVRQKRVSGSLFWIGSGISVCLIYLAGITYLLEVSNHEFTVIYSGGLRTHPDVIILLWTLMSSGSGSIFLKLGYRYRQVF